MVDCTSTRLANQAAVVIPLPQRQKVLVVLHADGFVEVFGERHVDVHIVNRLHVEDEDASQANLLDAYHEGTMPWCYRQLYWPNKLRAVGLVEKRTPEKMLDTIWQLSILKGLREARR